VANNFAQVHTNHEELLQGLNASEFNLRAHQKVLNAIAIDMEQTRKFLAALIPDGPTKDELLKPVLQMADVPVAPQQGDELQQTVRRIDWPGYHSEVEADLKRIAEIEKQRAEAQKKAAEEEAQRLREESEKAKAEAEVKAKEEAQQEAAPPPQDEDPGVPEGATVFGGDV